MSSKVERECMPWILRALSTIRPATSPCLSIIRLDFRSFTREPMETVNTEIGSGLRRIADEFARIEREFEGAVNLTMVPNPKVRVVLDTLNLRFSFVGWKKPCGHVYSSSFVPCRSFSTTSVERGRLPLPLASRRSLSRFPPRLMGVWCGCFYGLYSGSLSVGSHPGSASTKRNHARRPIPPPYRSMSVNPRKKFE